MFHEADSGALAYAPRPVFGRTFLESWDVLFVGDRDTNTSLVEGFW